jgi:hypothetical protein
VNKFFGLKLSNHISDIPYLTTPDTQISEVVTQNAGNLLPFQVPRTIIVGKGQETPLEEGGLKRNHAHGPIIGFCFK